MIIIKFLCAFLRQLIAHCLRLHHRRNLWFRMRQLGRRLHYSNPSPSLSADSVNRSGPNQNYPHLSPSESTLSVGSLSKASALSPIPSPSINTLIWIFREIISRIYHVIIIIIRVRIINDIISISI